MRNITNGYSLTLLGLVIAALGVISPIAWDWWNKRTQITIETKSNVSIVSISQPIKNLELLYNGKKVSELHKVVLVMRNSGKTPVTKDDVISPLTLNFTADEILEAVLARKDPKNLGATASLSGNVLVLGFDLFNPSDEAEIEILIAGKYDGFTAGARIKNITNIEVTDTANEKKNWKNLGVGAYISAFFGFIFVLAGIALLAEIPKKKIAASLIKQGASRILQAKSSDEAINYLANDFGFLAGSRRKNAKGKIAELDYPLNEAHKAVLAGTLVEAIDNEDSFGPAVVVFVISGIASWYVLSKLIAL